MEISLTTPSLLFPAISLLLLAYTNRFLAVASLIRGLHAKYLQEQNENTLQQIRNLRLRIFIIRNMQAAGVTAFLLCVISMFLIFWGKNDWAKFLFGLSLLMMIVSMVLSLSEIFISVKALDIELKDIEEQLEEKKK